MVLFFEFHFLFIGCWHLETSKFFQKKKRQLEYFHFATPSELMYLGIDHQQLLTSQKERLQTL